MSISLAIVTDGIFPESIGGIQRHSLNLVKYLSDFKELSIHVIHPHKIKLFANLDNVQEHYVEDIDSGKLYLRECHEYSKRTHKILSSLDLDIVYAQGISVWYKASEFKDRLIVNPHGIEAFQANSVKDKLIAIPFKLVQRSIFRKARYVITEGGHLTSYLNRASGKESKVKYIPNATDKTFEAVSPNKFEDGVLRCLFVARFAGNKGIQTLMDAIEKLNAEENGLSKFTFDLVGKGPLFNHMSNQYGDVSNIHFLGFVKDEELDTLYEKGQVFVFPTLFEGMPTAIIEAMGNGLPVIASDTGAIPELVSNKNGFLIRPGDANQLARTLKDFSQLSEETKKSLSENSLKKVKDSFNWQVVAKKHLDLFKSCS